MYVPAIYRAPDPSWIVDLIRGHPLALLTSNGDGAPNATHVPVILPDQDRAESAGLDGITLLGHMNRSNPHWSALADGMTVLLVFHGPQSYVSPVVYGVTPASPTWDFTAVHVRGVLTTIQDRAETLAVVRSTVRTFESRFGQDWDMSTSLDYFARIVPGVGAFRITITGAEGMFKLSQEQPDGVRERVLREFAGRESDSCRGLARLMVNLRPTARTGT